MIKNSIVQSFVPGNFMGINLTTREGVRGRAHELAMMAGRFSWQVTRADYELAEQELTAERDLCGQALILAATSAAKDRGPQPS